jgi:prefoldin subunit 5
MSDDITPVEPGPADAIVADAGRALDVIDHQIAQMREQRKGLGEAIAQALQARKPLARIVAAAHGRQRKAIVE